MWQNHTKEVATPVTFAILVIAAVFIPLLSLGGLAGKLLQSYGD